MLRAWDHPQRMMMAIRRYVRRGEEIQFSPFHSGGAKSPSSKIQQRRMKRMTLIAVSAHVRSRVIVDVAMRFIAAP
jgi:hypothetical protein